MIKVAVMGVVSFLIMLLEVPLPVLTPDFLKIDLSDLPAIVGGFALGPAAGVFIEFVKILLKLAIRGTATAGVGELANFLIGSIYVVTASLIYKKYRSRKGMILGLSAGTIVMSLIASFLNYTVLLPFYSKAYGLPLTAYVDLAKEVNSLVVDLRTFIIFGIFPFNMIKGILVSIVSYPIYRRIKGSIEI